MVSFSIIIPTKDRPKLLRQAVDSVIRQTLEQWELIIVNDSDTKLEPAFSDDRIIVLPNDAKGRNAARNTGIKSAKHNFVCFLDDDDLYEPNFLQAFSDFYLNHPHDVVVRQGLNYLRPDGSLSNGVLFDPHKYNHQNEFLISEMVGMVSFCYPSYIFDVVKLDERFHLWEDTHFLLRLGDAHKFHQIAQYGYIYRMHDEMGSRQNMSSDTIIDSLKNNIAPIKDYFQNHNKSLSAILESKLVAEKTLEYAISDLVYGNGKNATGWFKESLKTNFSFSNYKLYYHYIKAYLKDR